MPHEHGGPPQMYFLFARMAILFSLLAEQPSDISGNPLSGDRPLKRLDIWHMDIVALNHVGVRCTDFEAMEAFYIGVLGMKKSPQKGNWLSAGDTYAVHLMPATIDTKKGVPMDPATHFALQVTDLSKVLATLLAANQKPYQLSLQSMEPHYVTDVHDGLEYGLGTLFVDDPDANVVEFIDINRGIFAGVNYRLHT